MIKYPLHDRLELYEFGDQKWLRGWLRQAYVDCLNFLLKSGKHYEKMYLHFARWIKGAGNHPVIDLASGGAGPIDTLLSSAKKSGTKLPQIILSDLFPNVEHYRMLQNRYGKEAIEYLSEPVSATNVPNKDLKLRLICSSFHHFSSNEARQIIRDTIENGSGIMILEPFQRNFRHLLMTTMTGPFMGMLAPFFSEKFKLKTFLVCTLIPIIPLMLYFDGIVSVLRTHTFEEIMEMFPENEREQFIFEQGETCYLSFCFSTYFFAYKKK